MVSRLFRPRSDRMIGGVCGGLGLYFAIDPVIVRLIFVVLALSTGLTLILYPILWAIMPSAPEVPILPRDARFDPQTGQPLPPNVTATGQTVQFPTEEAPVPPATPRNRILAMVLVGVGSLIFLSNVGAALGVDLARFFIPMLLIGLGLYLLRGARA